MIFSLEVALTITVNIEVGGVMPIRLLVKEDRIDASTANNHCRNKSDNELQSVEHVQPVPNEYETAHNHG
jgi:hypothetical protein